MDDMAVCLLEDVLSKMFVLSCWLIFLEMKKSQDETYEADGQECYWGQLPEAVG